MKRGDLALLLGGEQRQKTASGPGHETGSKSPDNADIYQETYGEAETVAELVPFMLEAFIESDSGFAKARRTGTPNTKDAALAKSARPEAPTPSAVIGKVT